MRKTVQNFLAPWPRRSRGFTLIEVLAAMAILSILVLLLGQLFSGGSRVWKAGSKQANADATVRALLHHMGRTLSEAPADEKTFFYMDNDGTPTYGGAKSARLGYAAFSQQGNIISGVAYRTLAEYYYEVRFSQLATGGGTIRNQFTIYLANIQQAASVKCYNASANYANASAWCADVRAANGETFIDYVAKFQIWAQPPDGSAPVIQYDSSNYGNRLPLWVDIFLEVLSPDDAIKAKIFADTNNQAGLSEFLAQNAKRYAHRVYFINRNYGYR